jgi:RHS repeat-associated protein
VGVTGTPGQDYDTTYDYDSKGRLNQVLGQGLDATNGVRYDRLTNSDAVEYVRYKNSSNNDQITTHRAYESDRDLLDYVENINTPGSNTLSKYDYNLDTNGQRTAVLMTGEAFNDGTGNRHWDFVYNTRSELTGGDRRLGTTVQDGTFMTPGNYDYTYDPIGNRTNSNVDGASPDMTYTRNNVNQYTATADPSESFTYDDDGNLKTDATYGYTWDAENRLIRIEPVGSLENGSEKLEFKYDYMGRRVEKAYSVHNGTSWGEPSLQRFVYDNWNVVLVMTGTSNTISKKFTWGLDLSGLSGNGSVSGIHGAGGIGGLLAMQTTNDYAFLYDGNGNVVQIVRPTSLPTLSWSLWARFEYDPYGNIISNAGLMSGPSSRTFCFSTKWLDTELAGSTVKGAVGATGLYYYGYRYYSPRLGRCISRDPIGEGGGGHLFILFGNSPVGRFDLLGLATCDADCQKIFADNTAKQAVDAARECGAAWGQIGPDVAICAIGCVSAWKYGGPVGYSACLAGCGLVMTGINVYAYYNCSSLYETIMESIRCAYKNCYNSQKKKCENNLSDRNGCPGRKCCEKMQEYGADANTDPRFIRCP